MGPFAGGIREAINSCWSTWSRAVTCQASQCCPSPPRAPLHRESQDHCVGKVERVTSQDAGMLWKPLERTLSAWIGNEGERGKCSTGRKERDDAGCLDQREDSNTSENRRESRNPSLDSFTWDASSFSHDIRAAFISNSEGIMGAKKGTTDD